MSYLNYSCNCVFSCKRVTSIKVLWEVIILLISLWFLKIGSLISIILSSNLNQIKCLYTFDKKWKGSI